MISKKKAPSKKPVAGLKSEPADSNRHGHPKPGLGRGLGALFGAAAAAVEAPAPAVAPEVPPAAPAAPAPAPAADGRPAVIELNPREIERSPWQPRQTFDEDALRELADSIRSNGMIQPLICRKNAEGRFELVAGERRLRAAIAADLGKVPVVLIDATDRRAAEMAIVENIQRQDLNVIEEAEGYRTLAEKFSLTQQEVADQVGKARASVANALRLLDLPDEVKQMVGAGQLSAGHAKVLLGLENSTEQTLLGRKAVLEGMTVRSLERAIARRQAELAAAGTDPAVKPAAKDDIPAAYLQDITDKLHDHFATAVRLTPGRTHANGKHTKGILEIDFYDNADLTRILDILGVKMD